MAKKKKHHGGQQQHASPPGPAPDAGSLDDLEALVQELEQAPPVTPDMAAAAVAAPPFEATIRALAASLADADEELFAARRALRAFEAANLATVHGAQQEVRSAQNDMQREVLAAAAAAAEDLQGARAAASEERVRRAAAEEEARAARAEADGESAARGAAEQARAESASAVTKLRQQLLSMDEEVEQLRADAERARALAVAASRPNAARPAPSGPPASAAAAASVAAPARAAPPPKPPPAVATSGAASASRGPEERGLLAEMLAALGEALDDEAAAASARDGIQDVAAARAAVVELVARLGREREALRHEGRALEVRQAQMAQAQQLMADEFAEMEALVRREEPYGGAVVRLARERHEAEESVAPLRLRLRHADEEAEALRRDLARLRARNDALHERERRRKQGEPAWSGSAAAEPTGAPSPQPWIGQMQL